MSQLSNYEIPVCVKDEVWVIVRQFEIGEHHFVLAHPRIIDGKESDFYFVYHLDKGFGDRPVFSNKRFVTTYSKSLDPNMEKLYDNIKQYILRLPFNA